MLEIHSFFIHLSSRFTQITALKFFFLGSKILLGALGNVQPQLGSFLENLKWIEFVMPSLNKYQLSHNQPSYTRWPGYLSLELTNQLAVRRPVYATCVGRSWSLPVKGMRVGLVQYKEDAELFKYRQTIVIIGCVSLSVGMLDQDCISYFWISSKLSMWKLLLSS